MRAMILAAGLGTRLKPLTNTVSKPMIPMAGRPCMEHIVALLEEHGFTDIIANLHYMPEQIKSYFQSGNRLGVDLFYSQEKELLGTAGGLKKVENFFCDGDALVISGDALTDINLREFYRFHVFSGAVATLALKRVSDPSHFGVVLKDERHKITAFQEKPAPGEAISNLANTGIYLFNSEIFNYIPKNTFSDFAKDVFPRLLAEGVSTMGYEMKGYWCDVGNLATYREAHYDMLMDLVKVKIPAKKYAPHFYVGNNVHIHPDTQINGPMYIGDNCVIEKGARLYGPTSLGSGSVVRQDAFIKRSILWNAADIGASAYLRDCIIGSGCTINGGTFLEEEVLESTLPLAYKQVATGQEG